MGMKKSLLKAAGYASAPKLTFALNNPKKTAFVKAGQWAAERALPDRLVPRRRRPSTTAMALKGLGAAAVAVPVGWWLGRKVLGDGQETPAL